MDDLKLEKVSDTLFVYQKKGVFSYGTDAVLLSRYMRGTVKYFASKRVIDLCSGTGIIPLMLLDAEKNINACAVEISETAAMLSKMSAEKSSLCDRFSVVCGDIKKVSDFYPAESFEIVSCNPPYMTASCGKMCEADYKTIARHEILCELNDVFKAAFYLLKTGGSLFTVYRPNRLANLFKCAENNRFHIKKMTFVHSKADKEPTLVLCEAKKDASEGLIISRPFVIYESDGGYTRQMKDSIENNKL